MSEHLSHQLITHENELEKYSPPGHAGTVNVRLFDRHFCPGFEMVLGKIEAGGEAERHHHDNEYQAMYVLSGQAKVTLNDEAPVICGPGGVIQLPPGVDHHVASLGPETLELMIVYSPPLPKRADTPLS